MRTFRNIFVAVAFFLFFCFSATSGFASDFDNQIIFGDSSPVIMDGTSDNVLNWESFDIYEDELCRGRRHVHVIVDDEGHFMQVCQ